MTKKSQPFMTLLGKRTSSFHQGKTCDRATCCKHAVYKLALLLLSLKCTVSLSVSYPYSEEYTKPTQYMNTRCPAWCDRILMSHTAQEFIHKVNQCLLSLYLKLKFTTFHTSAVFTLPHKVQNIFSGKRLINRV